MAQSTPVKRTPKKERDPKRIIAPLVVLAVIYIGPGNLSAGFRCGGLCHAYAHPYYSGDHQ